jgi:DtxR family Mn-dependent transcriptional regulator
MRACHGASTRTGEGDSAQSARYIPVMPRAAAPLTRQAEDYLKAIHALELGGEAAGTTDIAARLGIAAASVSGMLRRLAGQGLVTVERYKGAHLTSAGRREALQLIRRHRIIESYLVERLGFVGEAVHEEAERLEHAASDALIARMADALGHPTLDPHGAPIPEAQRATRGGDR